ncbi:MAG: hypothetical protein COB81_09905 [Flavobacteriaceae bacterium]|nr:MAG: hypothetical protein COB81_09905 [Flavobacteriaceae bacterium]
MNFKEKYGAWALITGGTSGIGAEIATQVAAKGLNIILVARRLNLLEESAKKLEDAHGVLVKIVQADLSKQEDITKVIAASNHLEIGLFVPCAAVETHGVTTNIPLEKELALIQLNITSVFTLTHYFAGRMVERGCGGVLLVSSIIGHMPNPYLSNYAGSKAYILNFGTSLHWEMKKKGVDVTVLSPGPTETPMMENSDIDMSKTPMTFQSPALVATYGIEALGKKAVVIPGFKNNMMVFMASRLVSTSTAIKMGGEMMEKVLNPRYL